MPMPELTKEQKAALVVSRIARTAAHHEAAHAPKKLRFEDIRRKANPKGPQGCARIVTHDMSKCRAVLVDHAANAAVLNGGASVFALPDLTPGEAKCAVERSSEGSSAAGGSRRDAQAAAQFDLRLDVSAATCVTFEGLEDFEMDAADKTAAFSKPERGVSITLSPGAFLFTFTETKFGTILITRREIAAIK